MVDNEDEALAFVHEHYPDGEIFSMGDVDDPAIGESPIYETGNQDDTWAVGRIYRRRG
ncbi:MAG: hypothetical protein WC343_00205 [Bacilli bacterium]|jgi:hypothetical protein